MMSEVAQPPAPAPAPPATKAAAREAAPQKTAAKKATPRKTATKRPTAKKAAAKPPALPTRWPRDVKTLAIDIGGTGLKASVLDAVGQMTVDRVKTDTPYPCPPDLLISSLLELVKPLPAYDRVSVGFPGLIRGGHVVMVPSLSRLVYGGPPDPGRVAEWANYPLEERLREAFGKPLLLANDADVQGCAVVSGHGFELVLTFGTGLGCALFQDGELLPHLELPHGPFRQNQSFEDQLGNAARKAVGPERWNRRLQRALDAFDLMVHYDHVYLGGGNARKIVAEGLGPKASVVDNTAGILGGIKLWERHGSVRRG
jgi:polyphosphate glucokinase